jgi:predicted dehydrogenase
MKKRIIVVGLGSIGYRHARLLSGRDDVRLEVCDGSSEALQKVEQLDGVHRVYTTYEDALQSRPDIVFLCTPTQMHVEQSMLALVNGCHVFCEKPMTTSLAIGKALVDLTNAHACHFNVGFHLHFHRGLLRLKQLISEGAIGTTVHFTARVGTYITLANSVTRYQRHHAGSLFGDYTHQFDLLYWLTGQRPTQVFVQAAERGSMPLGSDPNVADLLFCFSSDLQAHVHLNYIQAPQRHSYEITGTKGWMLLDAENGFLDIGLADASSVRREVVTQDRDDIYRAEHQAFLERLAANQPQESPAAAALVSTAIYEAVMQAYATGTWHTVRY